MKLEKAVEIVSEAGEAISIPLSFEGERGAAILMIDGIRHHLERVKKEQLISEYRVDDDPNYQPQADSEGYCYILIPFSR